MPGPPDKWAAIDISGISTSTFASDLATAYGGGYQFGFAIGTICSLTGYFPASPLTTFLVRDQTAYSNAAAWANALSADQANGYTFQFTIGTWAVLAK